MYRRFIKRFLDIILSTTAMLILLPVYIVIAILLAITMGRPVLFSQERIGKGGKPFCLYKYRSMTDTRNSQGKLLPESQRLTKFGKFLRSSSLDELPELWAIFIGKMSFVGPRPMPVYYDPYFLEEERERHTVRGGLIPPDSLSLKPVTTYEEQFKYEVQYARNVTLTLDIKVIITTFVILYKRMKEDYGSDFRPHLNIYRSHMNQNKSSK